MTNTLTISRVAIPLVAAFALLSLLFAALPAGAQVTQTESCVLVKDIVVKTAAGEATLQKNITINPGTTKLDSLSGTIVTSQNLEEWGVICLLNTLNTVIDWISLIVLILSTALIIYAGFLWMTGGDNPENKEKAGKVILAALIGFGIVILARVLPAVVSGILL